MFDHQFGAEGGQDSEFRADLRPSDARRAQFSTRGDAEQVFQREPSSILPSFESLGAFHQHLGPAIDLEKAEYE